MDHREEEAGLFSAAVGYVPGNRVWDRDCAEKVSWGVCCKTVPEWEWGKQAWVMGWFGWMQVQLKPQPIPQLILELGWSFELSQTEQRELSLCTPYLPLTIQWLHEAGPFDWGQFWRVTELQTVSNWHSQRLGDREPSLEGGIQKHIDCDLVWFKARNDGAQPQQASDLPQSAERPWQSTEVIMLRREMIRSNLLRDQVCILSCQQVMKQECQSTGESKSGWKEGRRKFAPTKQLL